MVIEITDRQDVLKCPPQAVRRVLSEALRLEGRDAELSVALVGDGEMMELNSRYLGRAETTDVLAFPYGEDGDHIAGEIVVNAELAAREAAGRSHSAQDELMLYLVHGLLHLLGYDDHDPQATRRMRAREQAALKAAGRHAEF